MKKLFKNFLSFFLWANTIFNIIVFSVLLYYVFIPALTQDADTYYQKVGIQLRVIKNTVKDKIDPTEWTELRKSYYQKDTINTIINKDTIFEAKSND